MGVHMNRDRIKSDQPFRSNQNRSRRKEKTNKNKKIHERIIISKLFTTVNQCDNKGLPDLKDPTPLIHHSHTCTQTQTLKENR